MAGLLLALLSTLLPQLPGAFALPPRAANAKPLPRVYSTHRAHASYPVWIDARDLLKGDGKPDARRYLDPRDLRSLTQLLTSQPVDGCVQVREIFLSVAAPPVRATLEEAVAGSELAILGTVTETAFGFSGTVPGQLLRVVPERVLAGRAHTVSEYYAFVPVGTFLVGPTKICKTDSRYAEPPLAGEQVVLFVPRLGDPDPSEPFLDLFDDGGLVTIHSESSIDLPQRYRDDASKPGPKTKAELLERIRKAVIPSPEGAPPPSR